MKSVLFIGDSHLGAIKDACRDLLDEDFPLKFSFVGSPKGGLKNSVVSDGVLQATNEDIKLNFERTYGASRVDLSQFSALVIVGLGLSMFSALGVYGKQRTSSMQGFGTLGEGGPASVSSSLFNHSVSDGLRSSLAMHLKEQISACYVGKILVVPQPRPSERLLEVPRKGFYAKQMNANEDSLLVTTTYENALKEVVGRDLIAQPKDTIADSQLTHAAFTRGSRRLLAKEDADGAHSSDDVLHANALYGRRILNQVVARTGAH